MTHLIFDQLDLHFTATKRKAPIEPVLDLLRIFCRLVAHKGEPALWHQLCIGHICVRQRRRRGQGGFERLGCERWWQVAENESRPVLSDLLFVHMELESLQGSHRAGEDVF